MHVPENWPPCRLPSLFHSRSPLLLSFCLSLSASPCLPSMPPPVCTAPPRDIVRCTFQARVRAVEGGKNEKRIDERCNERKKKKKEREREKWSVLRARENKIVKRRSRCDVANKGYDKVQPSHHSLSFANRDLRRRGAARHGGRKTRSHGFDLISWTRSDERESQGSSFGSVDAS